MTVHIGFIRWV
ncbi:TPA: hypothetical protein ANIA_11637 [Aspergillus nidulans FGSC A4]|uniref:Uncharacterized protein n=1 Tax=Emericella nidulans (strain FGSC A4 / ATCC 38163 / CBS 112.46 / NRRL 194 / M139) TaxID=227321 RepID=C8VL94_EMENI|nr:TPA: hypothetical protein ANIA_11637 [Aspergillus nidulans FGSC A4]